MRWRMQEGKDRIFVALLLMLLLSPFAEREKPVYSCAYILSHIASDHPGTNHEEARYGPQRNPFGRCQNGDRPVAHTQWAATDPPMRTARSSREIDRASSGASKPFG